MALPSLKIPTDLSKLQLNVSLPQQTKTTTQAVLTPQKPMTFPVETPQATEKLKEVAEGGKYFPVNDELQIKFERGASVEKVKQKGGSFEQQQKAFNTLTPTEMKLTIDAVMGFTSPLNLIKKPVQAIASKLAPKVEQEVIEPVVQKVINALKESKPVRKTQEALYTAERGQKMAKSLAVGAKTSGEAGFYSELGQLKGELPKVQFESIRSKIGQEDIDGLFNKVKDSSLLNFWQKVSAREGLAKLFGEFGGKVPTESELVLLNRVFPKEFTKTLLEKRPLEAKIREGILQGINVSRSVMSSFDLSAPFRQGLFLISHPKRFFGAFPDMFKAFGSENAWKAIQEEIIKKPSFNLMQQGELALTEMDSVLGLREEKFMSQWAEKIPIIGRVVRASGRAYTGFLNKLRADVFDDLILKAEKLGRNPKGDPNFIKEVADFINNASGRGKKLRVLGIGFDIRKAATLLNSFLYSSRLMASRLTLLDPVYYIKANPLVRKEALKSLFTLTGVSSTILGLSKLAGADVETDPRSSDFAKIKIGNTRIDILGGFQQYIRMASQLITGKYVSSTTGKEYTLGEGYKPLTRWDILQRQVESKEAPVFSFITDLLRQQNYAGEPISIKSEIVQRFTPMVIGDMVDIYKDDPNLLPIGLLDIFGMGTQTYEPTFPKSKKENPYMPSMKMPSMQMPSLKMPKLTK